MLNDLIAYCGVSCADCSDYTSQKCPSCRQTEWQERDACMPVECCRKKEIPCCGECSSFPCGEMRDFYNESESHKRAYELMLSVRGNG